MALRSGDAVPARQSPLCFPGCPGTLTGTEGTAGLGAPSSPDPSVLHWRPPEPAMDICVIFNPAAARGCAQRRWEAFQRALGSRAEFRVTEKPGHAEDLALAAAKSGFAVVAAAGGDGTLHEVANGILRSGNSAVSLALFPMGSANDYADSLGLEFQDALSRALERPARHVDVGQACASNGRQRYFINTCGLGFSGAVTFESRKIRRLRGPLLYSVAFLRPSGGTTPVRIWRSSLMVSAHKGRLSR